MARQSLVELTYMVEAKKRANGTWPGNSLPHPKVAAILESWGIRQRDERLTGVVEHLVGDFTRHGDVHEVRVSGVEQTLFVAPTTGEAERLVREGITRGRIWTVRELAELSKPALAPAISRPSLWPGSRSTPISWPSALERRDHGH
jgi:hypothetical protein